MGRRLRSVHLKRFKCISDATFDVGDVNVIVGANNSGKSSVIQALHFAVGALQTARLEGRFPDTAKSGSISTSLNPDQLIYSPSKNVSALGPGGKLFEDEKDAISVTLILEDGRQCTVTVRKGRNRNILVGSDNKDVAFELGSLEEPYSVFSPGLAGIAKDEHFISDGMLLRTIARGDANLVLRNTLLRLWNTPKWSDFVGDLSQLFPDIEFEVQFQQATDEYISVDVKRGGASSVPLELAGTGVLQATQILSYIHQFAPALVVLDEPDSHLHPNNQRLLCSLLEHVAEKRKTQVLLTTHSRHVVDALGSSANLLWVHQNTVDRADRDDEIGILIDIGALDIKERAAQPNAKVVVLTEDEQTRPLATLLIAAGFKSEHFVVLPYYGCTTPNLLRPLLKMVRATNPKALVIVHQDRDFLTDDEAKDWQAQIRRQKAEPFLTSSVDIEGHFLRPTHLASLNTGVVDAEFARLLDVARDEVHADCVEKYVNGRIDILRKAGRGAEVNAGRLASEASQKLKASPEKLLSGKLVLAALRRRFRQENKHELRVIEPSNELDFEALLPLVKKAPK